MNTLGKILLAILAAPFVLFAVIIGGTLLLIVLAVLAVMVMLASVFRGTHGYKSASATTFRFGVGNMGAASRRPPVAFREYAGGKTGHGRAETDLTLDEGVRWETVEDDDKDEKESEEWGVGADENGDACPTCGGEGRTEK